MDKAQLNKALETLNTVNFGNTDAANIIKAQIAEIEKAEKAEEEIKAAQRRSELEAKNKAKKEQSIKAAKEVLADVIVKLANASNDGMYSLIHTLKTVAKEVDEHYDYTQRQQYYAEVRAWKNASRDEINEELINHVFSYAPGLRHFEVGLYDNIRSDSLKNTLYQIIKAGIDDIGEIDYYYLRRVVEDYVTNKQDHSYSNNTINTTFSQFFSDPKCEFSIIYKDGHKTIIRREPQKQQQVS